MIMLDYAAYRRKLRGCFVGKAIGGTLGMPLEGYLGTKEVTYYDPVPTGMVANDDLDLQVVWLEVIRRCGPAGKPAGSGGRLAGTYAGAAG